MHIIVEAIHATYPVVSASLVHEKMHHRAGLRRIDYVKVHLQAQPESYSALRNALVAALPAGFSTGLHSNLLVRRGSARFRVRLDKDKTVNIFNESRHNMTPIQKICVNRGLASFFKRDVKRGGG